MRGTGLPSSETWKERSGRCRSGLWKKQRNTTRGKKLEQILEPINSGAVEASPDCLFGRFLKQVYLPFYKRKWKPSTTESNEDRFKHHLTQFEDVPLNAMNRIACKNSWTVKR
jgi:hypothetical protein